MKPYSLPFFVAAASVLPLSAGSFSFQGMFSSDDANDPACSDSVSHTGACLDSYARTFLTAGNYILALTKSGNNFGRQFQRRFRNGEHSVANGAWSEGAVNGLNAPVAAAAVASGVTAPSAGA